MSNEPEDKPYDDKATITIFEHLVIRDGETKEVFVDQREKPSNTDQKSD